MIAALLGLLALLLFGGGDTAFKDVKHDAKKHVEDSARRDVIVATMSELEEEMKLFGRQIDAHLEQFADLHLNYHSTRADFDDISRSLLDDQQTILNALQRTRSTILKQTTEDEWNAVFSEEN